MKNLNDIPKVCSACGSRMLIRQQGKASGMTTVEYRCSRPNCPFHRKKVTVSVED